MGKHKTKTSRKKATPRKKWKTTETMTRTVKRTSLGGIGSPRRRVIVVAGTAVVAAAVVGGVLLMGGGSAEAAPLPDGSALPPGTPEPPVPQGQTQAEKDAALARQADGVFGVALAAANAIVSAAASPAALARRRSGHAPAPPGGG